MQIHSQSGNYYFLSSDTELSGSPPRREPPRIFVNQGTNHTSSSENIAISRDDHVLKHTTTISTPLKPVENANIYTLGLPILHTGISCSVLFP